MVATPSANIMVINITFDRSLKTVPKYAGSIIVMQQGAKSMTIPPKKATISDALANIEVKVALSVGTIKLLIKDFFYLTDNF